MHPGQKPGREGINKNLTTKPVFFEQGFMPLLFLNINLGMNMKPVFQWTLFLLLLAGNKAKAQAPFITYFTPEIATTGDTIEINGFSFDSTIAVHFGDSLAASFTVVSDNKIKAVVGFCIQGFSDVKVTTLYGNNSRPGFQFIPTPYITSFSPVSAGQNGVITITGINLDPFNSITFGGVAGSVIQPGATSTSLQAIVGAGASGNVHIFNSFGGSSLPGFTYVSSIVPNFTFSPVSGSYFPPATIQFIDLTTSTAPITNWFWDFGDGGTSTLSNPLHIYSTAGTYAVKLSVNASGGSDTVIKLIQIGQLIERNICPGSSTHLVSDTGSSIQWQVSMDSLTFSDISNGPNYSGVNDDTLHLNNLPSSFYGRLYRCVVNGIIKNATYVVKFSNNWTGTVSSAWENPANWSCGTVPDSGTDVIINSGTVVLNTNTTIRSLRIAPGVSFTVAPGVVLTILH